MNYQEYADRVRKMNPIDDDLLRKMAEDKDFCQEVIQTVLEDTDLVVVEVKSQDFIKNLQGRSVILDAHCVTKEGTHVNVEVQKSDDDNHQKRVDYVNAYVKDGSPTSELMTIFTEDEAYDDRKFPSTSRRKRYFKEDEKGVNEMCAIMQEVKEQGRIEGLKEGRIGMVLEMYRDEKISLSTACTYLGLTEDQFLEEEKKYNN